MKIVGFGEFIKKFLSGSQGKEAPREVKPIIKDTRLPEGFSSQDLDFKKVQTLYHGSTKTFQEELMKGGFQKRPIMFTTLKDEAIKYSISYSTATYGGKRVDDPVLMTLDASEIDIITRDSFDNSLEANWDIAALAAKEGYLDGVNSDPPSEYYVLFSYEKLDEALKNGKIVFHPQVYDIELIKSKF